MKFKSKPGFSVNTPCGIMIFNGQGVAECHGEVALWIEDKIKGKGLTGVAVVRKRKESQGDAG